MTGRVTDDDYRRLLAFRTGLRRFLRWSEHQAEAAGITAAQHQLLLAIRGHDDRRGPTIGDLSASLLLRHHSTVELIDRAEAAGLLHRVADKADGRVVRVLATRHGSEVLRKLTRAHLDELARMTRAGEALWDGLESPTR